jgi:hypothetical protein
MTTSPDYDSADLDALLELQHSPGYKLLLIRIDEELERLRDELETASGSAEGLRGQCKALRTVLAMVEILKAEVKNSLTE